jgi:hypothetical protein
MLRTDFEKLTKPLYDELREFSEDSDMNWLVRDSENEFWIWDAANIATIREQGKGLVGFSNHGPIVHLESGQAAFDFVIGVFFAPKEEDK